MRPFHLYFTLAALPPSQVSPLLHPPFSPRSLSLLLPSRFPCPCLTSCSLSTSLSCLFSPFCHLSLPPSPPSSILPSYFFSVLFNFSPAFFLPPSLSLGILSSSYNLPFLLSTFLPTDVCFMSFSNSISFPSTHLPILFSLHQTSLPSFRLPFLLPTLLHPFVPPSFPSYSSHPPSWPLTEPCEGVAQIQLQPRRATTRRGLVGP